MAEKKTSHTQQSNVLESMWEQVEAVERKGYEQAHAAIEESARLFKETLTWQTQLNAEWRRLAIEATRRMGDAFSPRV